MLTSVSVGTVTPCSPLRPRRGPSHDRCHIVLSSSSSQADSTLFSPFDLEAADESAAAAIPDVPARSSCRVGASALAGEPLARSVADIKVRSMSVGCQGAIS